MSASIGSVETQFATLVSPGDEPFPLACGDALPELRLAYETYGRLNEARDNAVLLFHALSGSQHAAGINTSVAGVESLWHEECHLGWWDDFIGPGKALDTDRYFVICANYLGGCYGSTGPACLNPATGKPWGKSFPHLSASDVVRSQALLLDHLGIGTLHAVVGASTGGLMTLTFATLLPERTRLVVSIASGGQTTVLNRLFLLEQILAIENDPHFKGGDYYNAEAPLYGLALARMISHKCFVHLDAIERRARHDVMQSDDRFDWYRVRHQVESYMLHQGKKFTRRFDANTYLRICEIWSAYDPVTEGGAANMLELLKRSRAHGHHWLVFSIDQDYCFYPEEQAALVRGIKEAGVSCVYITVHSDKGHDSFLLEPELYTPHLSHTLSRPV